MIIDGKIKRNNIYIYINIHINDFIHEYKHVEREIYIYI